MKRHSYTNGLICAALLALGVVCVAVSASAQQMRLAWDASPDSVSGYRIYAGTNTAATNALVKLNVGTNLIAAVDGLAAGNWTFWATAYTTNGGFVESLPSNLVFVRVPPPPAKLVTVAVQWNGSVVSTNWQDAGFFRLKLGQ